MYYVCKQKSTAQMVKTHISIQLLSSFDVTTNGGCELGIHIYHFTKNINKLKQDKQRISRANKIKGITLINSYGTS